MPSGYLPGKDQERRIRGGDLEKHIETSLKITP